MTVVLVAAVLFEAAVIFWLIHPAPAAGAHMAGQNPYADELNHSVSASKRDLRRSIHPWSQSPVPDYPLRDET